MHYYQFNIGDYAKATRHLSNTEDLAYRRLIELYYDTERPLINDVVKLSRLVNMKENQEEIKIVLEDFFIETDEGFQQSRIDEEISIYHARAESARVNGKKGGRPKKAKHNPGKTEAKPKTTQSVNLANPKERVSKANQEPLTNNHKPITINQLKDQSAKANDALEIFNHWKLVMKKSNNSLLNTKRTKAISARLKEGYTVEQIKLAITGCSMTPHNMGQNDNGKKYDDLELICRDGSNVERFANNCTQAAPQKYSAITEQNINNIMNVELD